MLYSGLSASAAGEGCAVHGAAAQSDALRPSGTEEQLVPTQARSCSSAAQGRLIWQRAEAETSPLGTVHFCGAAWGVQGSGFRVIVWSLHCIWAGTRGAALRDATP
jgi:hypothetical protein